jgi:hypothetical protein
LEQAAQGQLYKVQLVAMVIILLFLVLELQLLLQLAAAVAVKVMVIQQNHYLEMEQLVVRAVEQVLVVSLEVRLLAQERQIKVMQVAQVTTQHRNMVLVAVVAQVE